jgi:hypothetical protein
MKTAAQTIRIVVEIPKALYAQALKPQSALRSEDPAYQSFEGYLLDAIRCATVGDEEYIKARR